MNDRTLKMYLFYCSNSLDREGLKRCCSKLQGDELKAISLPCSGKVDVPYLVKAFETGADGVAIITCKQDECHHLEGNMRAQKRAEAVDSLLEEVGLGRGRITVIQQKEAGIGRIIEEVEEFRAKIRNMPQPRPEASTRADTDNTIPNHSVSNAHHCQETST